MLIFWALSGWISGRFRPINVSRGLFAERCVEPCQVFESEARGGRVSFMRNMRFRMYHFEKGMR